jgi:hypothetical protein
MTIDWTIHQIPLGPLTLTGSEPSGHQTLHFPPRGDRLVPNGGRGTGASTVTPLGCGRLRAFG